MSHSVFLASEITPGEVLAGDTVEFVVRLTAGPGYTPGPSRIVFDFPGQLGFSRPTRLHHEEDGYLQVYVSNPEVTYDVVCWNSERQRYMTREFSAEANPNTAKAVRHAVLDLGAGMRAGDVLELHWGETGNGFGPGTKTTTVVPRPDFLCTLEVRYFDSQEKGMPDLGRDFDGYQRPVPDQLVPLSFRVRPRRAEKMRLLRKTDGALLLVHDAFLNIAEVDSPAALIDGPPPDGRNSFGAFTYNDKSVQIVSRRLPMTATAPMHDVFEGHHLYWGDIHTHSAFSNDCVERARMDMTPGDLMGFARQRAGLDFYAVTDHHQPWDQPANHIGRDRWRRTLEAVGEHDVPGRFLAFPGMEYRCPRGDTAVVFNGMPSYDEILRPEWTDVRKLWDGLAGQDYLSIAHFHNPGKLAPGEWWENVGAEPVLEIFSCHGSYEREDALEHRIPIVKKSRPDRYGAWFLRQGHRYGLVCNSDDHKGHVGVHGVTAVFARELTKEAIFEAYRARRVYGATNARMRVVFTANGALMGSVLPNVAEKTFHIDVLAEAPLKKVELVRNAELHSFWTGEGAMHFRRDVVVREDEPSFWYIRATQLDNHVAWSSPVWFDEQS